MAIRNGTSGSDTINGTSSADTINGLGGNDILNGLGGDDLIHGNDGKDRSTVVRVTTLSLGTLATICSMSIKASDSEL